MLSRMDLTLKMAESALQESSRKVSESVKISSTFNHRNCELKLLIIEHLSLDNQAQSLRSSLGEMTREQIRVNSEHEAHLTSLTSTKDAAVSEAERLDDVVQRSFLQLERLTGIIEELQADRSPQPPKSVLGKRKESAAPVTAEGSTKRQLRPRK